MCRFVIHTDKAVNNLCCCCLFEFAIIRELVFSLSLSLSFPISLSFSLIPCSNADVGVLEFLL